jgi:hypothetical protein
VVDHGVHHQELSVSVPDRSSKVIQEIEVNGDDHDPFNSGERRFHAVSFSYIMF